MEARATRRLILLQAVTIEAACLWIYGPALQGGWLWDDDELITQNALVHDPAGLWKIWLEPASSVDFEPVEVSVVWLEWQLWGSNTLGYHLVNVGLHFVSALLVWRLLRKLGLRMAWLGGLLFAVHPAMVESVAWIAETKNTISLPPFLLAMGAWIDFEERGRRRDYCVALGLFVVAMLAKATMVMFPVVLLLYAWWKRGRTGWNDVRASAPFFLVSLVVGAATLWFLHTHSSITTNIPIGGVISRLALAGLSLAFYLWKYVVPVGLMPLYPQWPVNPPAPWQFLPWPVLAGILYGCWTARRGWGRHALLGLGFFFIMLVPFVGFTTATYMALTWVMDHVLYVPIVGLIGLAVAGMERLDERLPRWVCPSVGFVAAALLAWTSHAYAAIFAGPEALWTYTVNHNPGAWGARNNLAEIYRETGRVPEAIEQSREVLRLKPGFAMGHYNLGIALQQAGHDVEAITEFEQALQAMPDSFETRTSLASALIKTGQPREAIEQYEQALRIAPRNIAVRNSLGVALTEAGRASDAIELLATVVRAAPESAESHYNFANALAQTGRLQDAIGEYELALRIKPNFAEAHNNLAVALSRMGRTKEAIEQFEETLRIAPDHATARINLAKLRAGAQNSPPKP